MLSTDKAIFMFGEIMVASKPGYHSTINMIDILSHYFIDFEKNALWGQQSKHSNTLVDLKHWTSECGQSHANKLFALMVIYAGRKQLTYL